MTIVRESGVWSLPQLHTWILYMHLFLMSEWQIKSTEMMSSGFFNNPSTSNSLARVNRCQQRCYRPFSFVCAWIHCLLFSPLGFTLTFSKICFAAVSWIQINANYICFLSSSVPFLRKKSFSTCQTSSETERDTKKNKKNIVDSFFQVVHGKISSRRIA